MDDTESVPAVQHRFDEAELADDRATLEALIHDDLLPADRRHPVQPLAEPAEAS